MKKHPKGMTLEQAMRRMKPTPAPTSQAEFDELLAAAARDLTGAGPGDPEYDAIVDPPRRGRPAKGASRASIQCAIRLPAPLMEQVKAKAKRRHMAVNAALREAAVMWAAKA